MAMKSRSGQAVSQVPHALVCTPAYDGKVYSDYAQAMAEVGYCMPLHQCMFSASVMGNGAFIELARNIYAKKFLEVHTDCTHLFFVDADLRFHPNAFIGLLKSGLDICAGVYRRRQDPEDYPFKHTENPNGGGLWFVDDWLQCDRVPTGFLCISRKVIEEMAEDAPVVHIHDQPGGVPWIFDTKLEAHKPKDGAPTVETYGEMRKLRKRGAPGEPAVKMIGEDYTFCDNYRAKYGKPIPVWTNFDFTHAGYKGNFYEWLQREFDKKAAAPNPVVAAAVKATLAGSAA